MTEKEYNEIKLPETFIRTKNSISKKKRKGLVFTAYYKSDGLLRDKNGKTHYYECVEIYDNSREIMLELENEL